MSRHETPGDIIASLTRRHSQDGYTSYPELCRAYEAKIHLLCADLAVYRGTALTPQVGCELFETTWGDAPVLIELEIEPEEGDGWHEPHHQEQVEVIGVLVNGRMCSADLADDETRDRWIAEFLKQRAEDRDAALIDAHISAMEVA